MADYPLLRFLVPHKRPFFDDAEGKYLVRVRIDQDDVIIVDVHDEFDTWNSPVVGLRENMSKLIPTGF